MRLGAWQPGSARGVVVAPDAVTGSPTAAGAAAALARGLRRGSPDAEVAEHPVADGGEGTVDLVLRHGFAPVAARVPGPLGAPVEPHLAVRGDTAVVAMATAAGPGRLPGLPDDATARAASTAGVGELLAAALPAGRTDRAGHRLPARAHRLPGRGARRRPRRGGGGAAGRAEPPRQGTARARGDPDPARSMLRAGELLEVVGRRIAADLLSGR